MTTQSIVSCPSLLHGLAERTCACVQEKLAAANSMVSDKVKATPRVETEGKLLFEVDVRAEVNKVIWACCEA